MDNKVLIVEYYEEDAGRQSEAFYHEDEETGDWAWKCPKDFNENEKEEWHRIIRLLSDVEGMDLRGIICGVGLRDHCLGSIHYNYLDEVPEE